MVTKAQAPTEIVIQPIQTETITVAIQGTRPLILNRLAEKARHELLMPKGRKSTAERAQSLKHDPFAEYKAAPYVIANELAPTLLGFPASAIKGAMMQAALRIPGAKKTEIAQLVWVEGDIVPVFGIPQLFMSITRSADMNRTPDIRTRVIVPKWTAVIDITFTVPLINETSVVNLLSGAGQICGIGDWRPEKGKGTFGQFKIVNSEADTYQAITSAGGRAVQMAAMETPEPYDAETEELLSWFASELKTRGTKAA
jgi:hypothetical protein